MTATRRTQAERTAITRAALANAAIDLLIEKGWAATTAIEVCSRVGVTRGAFHHHYETLPELLADALRRLYGEMVDTSKPKPATVTMVQVVDGTWRAVGNPRFKAVLEAWLAMTNDPTLRGEIGPVVAGFAALVMPDERGTFGKTDDQRDFVFMARETMLGLALGRATNGGKALGHEKRVLARLRAQAAAFDAS